MEPSLRHSQESELAVHSTARSVSDLIADWPADDVFDAQQILARNPELQDNQSVVLDLAYEEYCRRMENGEEIDAAEFVSHFPAVETSLLDLIDVHQVLYDNPSVLTEGVSPQWPEVGESHLDLKLLENIGSGSFSQVYIASEGGVGERRVVAKLCTNANHEASLLGRLEHPNIVPILSVKNDRQKNLSAICMPYMGRTTLAHAIEYLNSRDHQATPGNLVEMLFARERESVPATGQESGFSQTPQLHDAMTDIAVQLCRGLEFAHSRGVIHGDLKPSNILLTKQGTALLMDFNLSQQLHPESRALGGTLAYMAPEQLEILSQNRLEPQSVSCNEQTDVYSFGVLLTELFTGSHPYCPPPRKAAAVESARKLFEQQQAKPVTARDLAPKTGMSLAMIIAKCLDFDPSRRWASVADLRAALEQTMTLRSRTLRWVRRERKRMLSVAAGLCVSLIAASVVYAAIPYKSQRLFNNAMIALEQGQPAEAVTALTEAMVLEAKRQERPAEETKSLLVDAYMAWGNQFLNEDRYPQAIEKFEQAHKLDPSSTTATQALWSTYLQSGTVAFEAGRFSDAVADFSNALPLNADPRDVLLPLSRALLAEEKIEDAVNVAKHWVSLDEYNPRAVANLGYCFFKQAELKAGDPEYFMALDQFQAALDLLEKSPANISKAALRSNIGLCNWKIGWVQAAAKAFSAAIDGDQDFASAADRCVPHLLFMSSRLRSTTRDNYSWKRDQELSWIEDCVASDPNSVKLCVEAACCYATAARNSLGDPERRQQLLDQCLKYCRRASKLGMTERNLDKILSYEERLKEHQDWSRLKTTGQGEAPEEENFLLDPLL